MRRTSFSVGRAIGRPVVIGSISTVLVVACATAWSTSGIAPTVGQVANATYAGIFDEPVALRDGTYEGPPFADGGAERPRLVLWSDAIAFGEIDTEPGADAAALLGASSGGSGERVYLAVVGFDGERARVRGTLLVGDRTKVRSIAIANGEIVLEVVEAGAHDPACCPTELARKRYRMSDDDVLLAVGSEVEGTLSLRALDGSRWVLADDDSHEPPAARPTAEFDGMRLAGFAGCNRYSTSIEEPTPGTIRIGPIIATRMACEEAAMSEETRYLGRLQQVGAYTFLAGHLVLSWQQGEDSGSLRFDRAQPVAPRSASDESEPE